MELFQLVMMSCLVGPGISAADTPCLRWRSHEVYTTREACKASLTPQLVKNWAEFSESRTPEGFSFHVRIDCIQGVAV